MRCISQLTEWRGAIPTPATTFRRSCRTLARDAFMSVTDSSESSRLAVLITPGALYRLLRTQFDLVRPPACDSCRVPVPEYLAVDTAGAPNWWVRPCIPCEHGCDARIHLIVATARQKYRLAATSG